MALEDLVAAWAGGRPWQAGIRDWTQRREQALPELRRLIDAFESGELDVGRFASALDSFSKRRNFWGYRGHSGQMFLNMLMRTADRSRLEEEVRDAIAVPADERESEKQLERFCDFVLETRVRAMSIGRFPPPVGYVPYFVSFFWEAKSTEWPIYYPRSRGALVRHGLFRETGPFSRRYTAYRKEVLNLRSLLNTTTWGVEIFLFEITADEEAVAEVRRPRVPEDLSDNDADVLLREDQAASRTGEFDRFDLLVEELAETNDRIGATRAETVGTRRDLHSYLEALSLGLDTDTVPLPRFVEVGLYVSDAGAADRAESALGSLVEALGFVLVDEFPVVRRSFLRRFTARSRDLATRAELDERLREVERAVQIRELDLPQAQADALQGQAVADVITALSGVDRASVRFGSTVILKADDEVIVRTLTPSEMLRLTRDPTLIGSPDRLLAALESSDEIDDGT